MLRQRGWGVGGGGSFGAWRVREEVKFTMGWLGSTSSFCVCSFEELSIALSSSY